MLDIKALRADPKKFETLLRAKQEDVDLDPIIRLDEEIRALKSKTDELKAQRNQLSEEIGRKKRNKENAAKIVQEVQDIKEKLETLDADYTEKEKILFDLLSHLPNLPMEGVPLDLDPAKNICIKEWGERRVFSFPFKNHLEIGEKLSLFDFKKSAKMTGSNWPMYTDMGARLEWALTQYMIDIQRNNGFSLTLPPLLVRPEAMFGSAQLPKFSSQLFQVKDDDYSLYLIPTSEVPLNAMHMDDILEEEELPLKYMAFTPCFRREAGASGVQERGLIRMHQFHKVEMFSLTTPEKSDEMFDYMQRCAEQVLEGLGLHYRTMLLVSGDSSFASAKTVDIEVFLPGQDRYYEVSSVSNCTDFQARRSHIRFRKKQEKPQFVHTLNGSGLATSRVMVAILENFQREDGSVEIPQVLHRYLENEIQTIVR